MSQSGCVQVSLQEGGGSILPAVAGDFQQGQAEIQPGVGSAVTAAHQFTRQFAVPAAQVKDVFVPVDHLQDLLHTQLEPLAGGGKFPPEGLVELFIQCDEQCAVTGCMA